MSRELEVCPECQYTLIEKATYCPHCGYQLTAPVWKKVAAWFILILIVWGLVKCHIRLFQGGLEDFFEENGSQLSVVGIQLSVQKGDREPAGRELEVRTVNRKLPRSL